MVRNFWIFVGYLITAFWVLQKAEISQVIKLREKMEKDAEFKKQHPISYSIVNDAVKHRLRVVIEDDDELSDDALLGAATLAKLKAAEEDEKDEE